MNFPSWAVLVARHAETFCRRRSLLGLHGGALAISVQSPPIGTPMRCLNPVGVVDLDGDGRAEIAAVIIPQFGGTLKAYRRSGGQLAEIAALGGFSNHTYGSPELALSMPVFIAGDGRYRVTITARGPG